MKKEGNVLKGENFSIDLGLLNKDRFKKEFWISKGYSFYDPDIRNYSILEMIQLFFPNIKEVPDYVDFNFSNCINFNEVQELLDQGNTIKEISNILDTVWGE